LARSDRRLLLLAAAWLPVFSPSLRLLGLSRFQRLLSRSSPARGALLSDAPPQTLGRMVNIAANHVPWRVSCLERSLLLWWLLKRRGIAGDLKIGVRFAGEALDAHAWVECDGVPVNDTPDNVAAFAAFAGPVTPLSMFDV
jgi:hypothetical protein